MAKLQRVQNCLARVATRSPRFSRSVLKSLHWLPVHFRIIFKICTIAYQALSSTQPAYLNAMLTPGRNSRQLRSTTSNPLYNPRVKTKPGTRAFSVAATTVWNSLSVSVKSEGNIVSFRRRLLSILASSSIHWRLTQCFTILSLLNPLVLSRHWVWSSRILTQKNYYYYYYIELDKCVLFGCRSSELMSDKNLSEHDARKAVHPEQV